MALRYLKRISSRIATRDRKSKRRERQNIRESEVKIEVPADEDLELAVYEFMELGFPAA